MKNSQKILVLLIVIIIIFIVFLWNNQKNNEKTANLNEYFISINIPNYELISIDINDNNYKNIIIKLWEERINKNTNELYGDYQSIKDEIISHQDDEIYTKEYLGLDKSKSYILVNNYYIDRETKAPYLRKRHLDFYNKETKELYGSIFPRNFCFYYPYNKNSIIIGVFIYGDSASLDTLIPGTIDDYNYFLLKY